MEARRKLISIQEVANYAGVHRSTASRVLNNDTNYNIASPARRRILQAAQHLGFQHHDTFNVSDGTLSLGVVNPQHYDKPHDIKENPFYSAVIDGIDSDAIKHKINVYTINNTEGMNLLYLLEQENFLGIIIIGQPINIDSLLPAFDLTQKRLVVIEAAQHTSGAMLYKIHNDSFQGTYQGATYLIEMGHRHIYYLGFMRGDGKKEAVASLGHYEGLAAALGDAGVYTSNNKILVPRIHRSGTENRVATDMGYRAMSELIKGNPPRPFACLCYSDLFAQGAYEAAREHGLKIPQDVSIVGYGNTPQSSNFDPPLTTVEVPWFQMGCLAVGALLDIKTKPEDHDIILPVQLVIRDSVLPLND